MLAELVARDYCSRRCRPPCLCRCGCSAKWSLGADQIQHSLMIRVGQAESATSFVGSRTVGMICLYRLAMWRLESWYLEVTMLR